MMHQVRHEHLQEVLEFLEKVRGQAGEGLGGLEEDRIEVADSDLLAVRCEVLRARELRVLEDLQGRPGLHQMQRHGPLADHLQRRGPPALPCCPLRLLLLLPLPPQLLLVLRGERRQGRRAEGPSRDPAAALSQPPEVGRLP